MTRATSETGRQHFTCPSVSHRPGRSTLGFTLMELLVVLAIVGLIAALLPVAFNRALPARRVEVTSQRLLSAIRDAGSDSLVRGKPIRLEFHAERGVTRDGVQVVRFSSATEVTLADEQGRRLNELVVYPDGSISGGSVVIRERAHVRRIWLSEITGRLSFHGTRYRAR